MSFHIQIYPDWNIFDYFQTNVLHVALRIDSKYNTFEMTHYVDRIEDVNSIFVDNQIIYEKGNPEQIDASSIFNKFRYYSSSWLCLTDVYARAH